MPNLELTLEEQYSDMRSNEMAYRFAILNRSPSEIEIIGITPRIPEAVNLILVKNPDHAAVKTQHGEIAEELSELLASQVAVYDEKYRAERRKLFNEHLAWMRGRVFRTSIAMTLSMLLNVGDIRRAEVSALRRRARAIKPQIESSEDAEWALSELLSDANDYIVRIFRAKMEHLKRLEIAMKSADSDSLATVQTDSYFAQTYVLRFPRSALNPRKYNISIDVQYRTENGKEHVDGTASSVLISPRPYVLSTIAVTASILGSLLSLALVKDAVYLHRFLGAWVDGTFLGSSILGLVVFNVYEHIGLRDRFSAPVGWRSALLIGILCGLFQDRFLAALQALMPNGSG